MTRYANPKIFFASAKHYRLSSVTSTPLFTDGAPLVGIESFVASSEKQNAQNPDVPLLFNANERQVRMKNDSFFKVKMLLTNTKRDRLSSGNSDTPYCRLSLVNQNLIEGLAWLPLKLASI